MYYDYPKQIRRWNRTAAECYQRGCICQGCPIYELYFKPYNDRCRMKGAVLEMVRKFGVPESIRKKEILDNE